MSTHAIPTTGTTSIVNYLAEESRESVEDSVVRETKRRILDTLGSITSGFHAEGISTTTNYAVDTYAGGQATILDGSGRTLTAVGATLANTLAANALDIDDGDCLTWGHPAAVIIPAAISAGEIEDATVGDLIDAIIPSYEIAVRAGDAIHEWTGMYNGSGSWGAVGAAAAVSKLRDTDREITEHALGIAEFNAPITPVMRSVANPGSSMTKDGIGWGGHVGMTAVSMAERGLNGSGTVFDAIEFDGLEEDRLSSLGSKYYILDSYYKPYPACRWIHAAIDAVIDLFDEANVPINKITDIKVFTHQNGSQLGTVIPENADEAEYSFPFIVARTIDKGDWITPSDLNQEVRTNKRVRELSKLVSLHVDKEAQELYPQESRARVVIETSDGRYETPLTKPRGSKERPLTPEEHTKKQSILIDNHLGDGTAKQLRDMIDDETLPIVELLEIWQ